MAKEKKLVEAITSMEEDFTQWYTDVVKKAELMDYSSVKGCMIFKPNGYAIWENIQKNLDAMFKETGVENVYMPMFIPESLLQKEKDHVEGFAPEVAWVTQGGLETLQERLAVRPTSETLFCELFSKTVQSHRDLPKVYNQWCSVVRWEKTTRPFLRSSEFLWQEGHTVHATAEEAEARTVQMLNIYADFCEKYLAIPMVKGRKTDKDNKLQYCHETSWGVSTRLIGAIIMVHGDDSGLVLPPKIAPTQVMVIPIQQQKDGVLDKAYDLKDKLSKDFRVKIDATDKTPGWKFAAQEVQGISTRIEIGPKDIEKNQCVIVRRDTREKIVVSLDEVNEKLAEVLETMQNDMLEKAKAFLASHINDAHDYNEFKAIAETKPGFIRAMWCGDEACENKIKEDTTVTSRCMPFGDQEQISDVCVCCGKPAHKLVYWGKAY